MKSPDSWLLRPFQSVGQVMFGMPLHDVQSVLGEPSSPLADVWGSASKKAGWRENQIIVYFAPLVEMVEISAGGPITATFEDLDLFGASADDVLVAMRTRGHVFDPVSAQDGTIFTYRELGLSLWRWLARDNLAPGQPHPFDTVALGRKGYY